MKTAVIIHGFHLQAEAWESVMWGDPAKGVYGRIATGLREALRFEADFIFFGTGASNKDGLLEGEYILKFAREHIAELSEFAQWGNEKAVHWLEERAVLELKSQVTKEELLQCATIARERGVERLILVSSPTHILRAHQTAIAEFSKSELLSPLLHALYAVASDTSYVGTSVADVMVVEPPHRPDRQKVFFNETLKDLSSFFNRPDAADKLNESLKKVFHDFKSEF